MAIKTIPCGGFFYDDETISFEKDEQGRDVIKAVGGGGSDPLVLTITINTASSEAHADKSYAEFNTEFFADQSRLVIAKLFYDYDGTIVLNDIIQGVEYTNGKYTFIKHIYSQTVGLSQFIIRFDQDGVHTDII